MQQFFDKIQSQLADMLSNPNDNNVGYFIKEIFNNEPPKGFAEGGLATEASDISMTQRIANAANQTTTALDKSMTGRYGDTALGESYTNSAPYIASHYTQLGKFFSGAEPGNKYTDRFESPIKGQAPKSESPNTFYSRWYEGQRRFSEASEIANAGQTILRPR